MRTERFAHVAQIIACLGIFPAGYQIHSSMEEARLADEKANKAIKLAALGHINQMIKDDERAQAKVDGVIKEVRALPDHQALLEQYGSGRKIYYSIADLSSVGRHYEHLGAMIRLGYIDFDLLFEVVTFPDEFWNETRDLMRFIGDNWNGPGQPLSDLWSNFASLRELYHTKRAEVKAAGEK